MDTLRYTASARLGAWDSIATDREAFLSLLGRLLQHNARGSVEAIRMVETNDMSLASLTSICDKIAARGNPTLVDLDFENALLSMPELDVLGAQAISEGHAVGMKLGTGSLHFGLQELVNAAWDLLSLPFRSSGPGFSALPVLPSFLNSQVGPEEDYFLGQFMKVFPSTEGRIQRQVRLGDLVNCPDSGLSNNYVDFVVQSGPIKWVLELDGTQHEDAGQRAHDEKRDDVLRSEGWTVHRFPTRWIKDGTLSKRLARIRSSSNLQETRALESHASYRSVEDCVAISEVHKTAFFAILWPLAVHRCTRGLIQLYSHEALNSSQQQRILVLEEDIPAIAEAFATLRRTWSNIHNLASNSPAPPSVRLDILVEDASAPINRRRHAVSSTSEGVDVRLVSDTQVADEEYDIVLSHSFLLQEGYTGILESQYEVRLPQRIRLRQAVGHRDDRALQWSDFLEYELADVERAETTEDAELPALQLVKLDSLLFFLRLFFRKRVFKDGQVRVIAKVLQRKAAIALLPTGGGKSLIYQFSGLLLPGMVIVVDPLVSLMADQVENLKAVGIDLLEQISGRQERTVKTVVMNQMKEGKLAFTFISPERLQDKDFRSDLATVANQFLVSIAVIDEAHCISEWGHDFRPAYLHLPRTLERYCATNGAPPTILALTGTASFSVLTDIQIQMEVSDQEAVVMPKSFDRHELRFEVIPTPANQKSSGLNTFKQQLPRKLRLNPGSFYSLKGDDTNGGIVFVPHVNGSHGVTQVAKLLGNGSYFAGEKPKGFPGDYTAWQKRKDQVQHEFKRNRIQELVATKSFGMGIDKPNIRYTCHYMAPQSVESFYQEAGRAGRNGLAGYALCTILYSDDNWNTALSILNEPDHKRAMGMLDAVHWDNRGDLLFQSWFLLRTYKDRRTDKEDSSDLWRQLSKSVMGMTPGAINTVRIPFGRYQERAIYRLVLLGIIADYTIDWNRGFFAIEVKSPTPQTVLDSLRDYLQQYKFESYVRDRIARLSADEVHVAIEGALDVLVDFVYEEIVAKRKQALRTMGELCRTFESDSDFRNQILAYLQESEFSASLREWIGRSIDDIGIEQAVSTIHKVEDLEQRTRLIGTTRRMLDEAPDNLALRLLSVLARAAGESQDSILGEVAILAEQVDSSRNLLREPDEILLRMAHELRDLRPEVVDLVLRRAGNPSLARGTLRAFSHYPKVYSDAVTLLSAEALNVATTGKFNDIGDKERMQSHGKS